MAQRAIKSFLAIVAIAAAAFWIPAAGQSSCTSALITLAPCLSYISGNSSTPTTSCCSGLASMVQSQPQCLCSVVSGGASSALGISLNQTRALELPAACSVQTPPLSRCNAAAGSPAQSPEAPSSTSTPTNPSSNPGAAGASPTSASGSNSTTDDSSDARKNKSAASIILSALIFVSFFSSMRGVI